MHRARIDSRTRSQRPDGGRFDALPRWRIRGSVPRQLRLIRTATHSRASRSPPLASPLSPPSSHPPLLPPPPTLQALAPGYRPLLHARAELRQRTPKRIDGQTGKHPLAGQDRDTHRSGRPLAVLIVVNTKRFGRHLGRPRRPPVRMPRRFFWRAPSMGFHREVSRRGDCKSATGPTSENVPADNRERSAKGKACPP